MEGEITPGESGGILGEQEVTPDIRIKAGGLRGGNDSCMQRERREELMDCWSK